jgi:transmembrane protein
MNIEQRLQGSIDSLDQSLLLPVRALLCSPFLVSGISKAMNFQGTVAEVRGLAGLEPATLFAMLVILVQLGGSILLVLGRRGAWTGAVLLIGFTAVATLLAHPYWLRDGTDRVRDFNTFWEHVGLAGGLLLAAITLPSLGRPVPSS